MAWVTSVRMADQPPSALWPLEGYFRCGDGSWSPLSASGRRSSLTRLSHALAFTLPDINADVEAAWLRRQPWRFVGESEDRNTIPPDGLEWGSIAGGRKDSPLYAHILQCVVHSEVNANDEAEVQARRRENSAMNSQLGGLSVCDWLDVLTLQDFVGLGRAQRSILDDSSGVERRVDGIRKAGTKLPSNDRRCAPCGSP